MTTKVVLSCCVLLVSTAVAIPAQGQPALGCRAVGLFVLDVAAPEKPKLTVSPWKVEVSYPKPADKDREVCFAVVIVNGDKNDKPQQLRLKGFDTVKGRNGRPLFKAKKVHPDSVLSLEFDDVPDWDSDGDGVLQDVVQAFDIEAKFKGHDVIVDPEIVIQKPGG